MRMIDRRGISTLGVLIAAGLVAVAARAGEEETKRKTEKGIDPQADALVKRMSDFMAKQGAFTVKTEGALEVVRNDGQKLEFPFESRVVVKRPNKLRAERQGALTDLVLTYDGHQLVLYGKKANMYASAEASPTLDATIDMTRDRLGIDLPGADLIYSDIYEGIMHDLSSGTYVGKETVHGEVCEHVAFRGKEVDFQIWIKAGNEPVPCRYVVTTRGMKGQPEFTVELSDWNLSPQIDDADFTFRRPANAEKIKFLTPEDRQRLLEKRAKGKQEVRP